MEIDWHHGDRAELAPLFRLADDSESQLRAYEGLGRVLVARSAAAIVGHLQLVATDVPGEVEVRNMAVAEGQQGRGVGRALVERALAWSREEGLRRVVVATAAADIGNLRFYQRVGFRMLSIERDAFTPATGYPDRIDVDGIPLRDRVWLSQEL